MINPISFSTQIGIPTQSIAQPESTGNGFSNVIASFSDTLKAGEQAAIAGVTGEMPVQQVVEKVLEAERSLTTVISIRDKFVSSYLELSRMQI